MIACAVDARIGRRLRRADFEMARHGEDIAAVLSSLSIDPAGMAWFHESRSVAGSARSSGCHPHVASHWRCPRS